MTAPENDPPPATPDAPHVKTVLTLANAMQRFALIAGGAAAMIALVLCFVLRGTSGLVGSVIGVVIGLGIGFVGTGVMKATARATPGGVMIGALASFAGKFVVLLVFLLVFRGTELFDNRTFAFTLLGVTVAWIGGEIVGFIRAKVPAVDV